MSSCFGRVLMGLHFPMALKCIHIHKTTASAQALQTNIRIYFQSFDFIFDKEI